MVVKVVPSLKKLFNKHEYKFNPAEEAKEDGATIILAIHGEIFIIEKEFDVSMPQFNVAGTGTGYQYAVGAIRTGASIEAAMNVAAENDSNTSAPFTTIELPLEVDKVPVVKKRAKT